MLTTRLIPALVAIAVCAALAPAQSGSQPKPSDDKIDIWTEAKPILERELKALADCKSMRGSYFARWETQTEGQPATTIDYPVDFALSKPENLFLAGKDISVFTNGKTFTIYCKSLRQYITRPAPPVWSLRDLIEDLSGGQIRSIPSEAVLRPGMTIDQTLRGVRSMEKVRDGDYDGKPGSWVAGTGYDERQPSALPFALERWYSAADGLVYCIKQDWTRMYQDMSDRHQAEQTEGEANPKPAPKIVTANWTTTYQRKLNTEISPDVFIFKPGADDKQVDKFVFPRPNLKEQTALIGKPAPDLIGTDLDGKPVKLADLKGKVVVLDFWATWCGPCVQGLPHMQAIKDRLKDKPFVLLGVNRDAPGTASKVKRFLAKRGLNIAQFDDTAARAAEAYAVNGIPCMVIIDKDGVIQDIDVGFLPGKEREIGQRIDQVIAGKPLRTPEELTKLKAQVGVAP